MNEIMVNEEMEREVTDELMEVETVSSGSGLKTVATVGAIAGVGYLAYKFGIKPLVKKFKAKKGQTEANSEDQKVVDAEYFEVADDSEKKSDEKKKK